MLNFKLIEKSQINEYRKFYDYSSELGCDANLINAYLWRNEYNIKFAIYNDTLIKAYFNDDGTVWGYCMPTGKDVRGAVEGIFSDAEARNQKPHIVILSNGQRAKLETLFPSRFDYERSPENQDYIYLTKDLVTLVGKKFHSKRNFISSFYRSYPENHFETLDETNKEDAFKVALEWHREMNMNPDTSEEMKAIREALDNFDEFGMQGAVLYVEEKPVAMTLGSEISDRVFDINFEKAFREYNGVYAVINNEFAKTLTKYEYINREEDMGIEGLRKAKHSYNPVIVLDRYNAILR